MFTVDTRDDDGGLIGVLNAHASYVAQGKTLSDEVRSAFYFFLSKVEEHWLEQPNKNPNSPLGIAYFTFWKKHNEKLNEVRYRTIRTGPYDQTDFTGVSYLKST